MAAKKCSNRRLQMIRQTICEVRKFYKTDFEQWKKHKVSINVEQRVGQVMAVNATFSASPSSIKVETKNLYFKINQRLSNILVFCRNNLQILNYCYQQYSIVCKLSVKAFGFHQHCPIESMKLHNFCIEKRRKMRFFLSLKSHNIH